MVESRAPARTSPKQASNILRQPLWLPKRAAESPVELFKGACDLTAWHAQCAGRQACGASSVRAKSHFHSNLCPQDFSGHVLKDSNPSSCPGCDPEPLFHSVKQSSDACNPGRGQCKRQDNAAGRRSPAASRRCPDWQGSAGHANALTLLVAAEGAPSFNIWSWKLQGSLAA